MNVLRPPRVDGTREENLSTEPLPDRRASDLRSGQDRRQRDRRNAAPRWRILARFTLLYLLAFGLLLAWFETVHRLNPQAWPYTFLALPPNNKGDCAYLADLNAAYNVKKAAHFLDRDRLSTWSSEALQKGVPVGGSTFTATSMAAG
jgi:hypothetical protein